MSIQELGKEPIVYHEDEPPLKIRRLGGSDDHAVSEIGLYTLEQRGASAAAQDRTITPEDHAAILFQKVWRGYRIRSKLDLKLLTPLNDYFLSYSSYIQYILEGMERHVETLWRRNFLEIDARESHLQLIKKYSDRFYTLRNEFNEYLENPALEPTGDVFERTKNQLDGLRFDLKELSVMVGAEDVETILSIFFEMDWRSELQPKAIKRISELNKIFQPIVYKMVDAFSPGQTMPSESEFRDNENSWSYDFSGEFAKGLPIVKKCVFHASGDSQDKLYGAEVYIPLLNGKKAFVIKGYFDSDATGVFSERGWFSEKRKLLEEHLPWIRVPNMFKKAYFNQLSLRDILVYDAGRLEKMMIRSYELTKEFTHENIIERFKDADVADQLNILSILLCSKEKNLGYWLWEMLGTTQPGYQEFLYKNLHFSHQRKLEAIKLSMEEMRKALKEEGPEKFTLKQRVEMSEMPLEIKRRCLKMISGSEKSGFMGLIAGDDDDVRKWVAKLLEYPWGDPPPLPVTSTSSRQEITVWLEERQKILDAAVYGQEEVKKHLIRIAGRLARTGTGGTVIALEGPPGIGKTTLARNGISQALGIPFYQLEGKDDELNLVGTRTNYKNARPGDLFEMFCNAKSKRFVVFIDEFEKAINTGKSQNFLYKFMQIFDPQQNHALSIDNYFDQVPLDFSQIIWVVAGNDLSRLGPILGDRLTKIKLKPHKPEDKIEIAKQFTLPSLLKKEAFQEGDIVVSDEVLQYIIENYTFEAGIRRFEEKLGTLVGELADRHTKNFHLNPPYTIDRDFVEEVLKEPMMEDKKVPEDSRVGWVNGLYATKAGIGGVEYVEAQKMYGKKFGRVTITGTVGKMIEESAKVAYTVALSVLSPEKRREVLSGESFGLLVHHGNIGSEVDGPSSGSAIVTAIVSQLTGHPVKARICMTGEIGPSGMVKKIGGLREKLTGAKRAGCTLALVPKENSKDYDKIVKELPDLIEQGIFEVQIVERIEEVLEVALEKE